MFFRKFTRTKEDFVCENCEEKVMGDGYTNHCPHCLYSKHVDVHPGDRAAKCQGMMRPKDYVMEKGSIFIVHECLKCGFLKRNKVHKRDNQEALRNINKEKIYG